MDLSNSNSNNKNDNRIETLHGGDVYRNEVRLDFSVNLNPFPMPQEVTEAMQAGMSEVHQYPDPSQQKLREGIASLKGLDTENVICGNGASELLMAAVHAVRPKKALVAAPCYAGYAVALKAEDAEIEEYLLDEEQDFAVDAGILDQITDETGMVFIADPNNPNGRLIEPELKRAIIEKCEECGAVLVIDECFYPLTAAGTERMFREIFMAIVPGRAVPPRPVFRRTARVSLQDATESMVWILLGFFMAFTVCRCLCRQDKYSVYAQLRRPNAPHLRS